MGFELDQDLYAGLALGDILRKTETSLEDWPYLNGYVNAQPGPHVHGANACGDDACGANIHGANTCGLMPMTLLSRGLLPIIPLPTIMR